MDFRKELRIKITNHLIHYKNLYCSTQTPDTDSEDWKKEIQKMIANVDTGPRYE
jgi:hypothetical protein